MKFASAASFADLSVADVGTTPHGFLARLGRLLADAKTDADERAVRASLQDLGTPLMRDLGVER